MVAVVCNLSFGEFIWSGGDCHIYLNHLDQVKEQLSRNPNPSPEVGIRIRDNINDFEFNDFTLFDYNPHPAIKAKVSV